MPAPGASLLRRSPSDQYWLGSVARFVPIIVSVFLTDFSTGPEFIVIQNTRTKTPFGPKSLDES